VTEATLRLFGIPEKFSAAIVHFDSVEAASSAVYEIMGSGWGRQPWSWSIREQFRSSTRRGISA